MKIKKKKMFKSKHLFRAQSFMLKLGSEDLTNHKAALRVRQSMHCNGGQVLRYFLSGIIQAQENESRGTHFAKFLISNFLKGLTYSDPLI